MPVDYSRAVGDSGNAVIAFRNVRFSRGATVVLKSVDFGIAAGETVALVGRSGAGKSTILKLINRLLLPASGSVLVEGRPTTAWDPYDLRRRAGYVLQDVGLFPHLTVEANVSIVPRLLGWAAKRYAARAIIGQILPWTWAAFTFAFVTGAGLFITRASAYMENPAFKIKLVLIVLAGMNA